MLLIDRHILWLTIDLSRARKDDLHARIALAARFEDRELGARVDLEIGVWVLHRVHVARLTGQIEEIVVTADQVEHALLIADVGDIDCQTVFDAVDVGQVAAILRMQAVDKHDLGAKVDQAPGEVGPDEAQTASDQHTSARIVSRIVQGHLRHAWLRLNR
jgi:hypothetical protein